MNAFSGILDVYRYKPHLLPKVRSEAIKGAPKRWKMPCTLRVSNLVPGHQCAAVDTVVGAHLPIWGKGTSTKVTDMAVAFSCLHCHDILDYRDTKRTEYILDHCPTLMVERMLHGLTETHALLIQRGVIVIPDAEMV